jgi:hypothetical protein
VYIPNRMQPGGHPAILRVAQADIDATDRGRVRLKDGEDV